MLILPAAALQVLPSPPGSPLTAAVNPVSISGVRDGPGLVASNVSTVSTSGGGGNKTFSWAIGGGDLVTIDSPSSSATRVSATLIEGEGRSGTISCTVSDDTGSVVVSVTWSLEALFFGGGV